MQDSLGFFVFRGIPSTFVCRHYRQGPTIQCVQCERSGECLVKSPENGDKTFKTRCKRTLPGKINMVRSLDTAISIRTTCANSYRVITRLSSCE